MHTLFKFTGLLLIFCTFSASGFIKAAALNKRTEKLAEISRSLNKLAGYIKAEKGELGKLIALCFNFDILHTENSDYKLETAYLEKEDIEILNEFLKNLGIQDSESEYNRTVMYSELLAKQHSAAEKKSLSLCRLYRISGVLCGLFICIFLI